MGLSDREKDLIKTALNNQINEEQKKINRYSKNIKSAKTMEEKREAAGSKMKTEFQLREYENLKKRIKFL
jgi:hypothetical protein